MVWTDWFPCGSKPWNGLLPSGFREAEPVIDRLDGRGLGCAGIAEFKRMSASKRPKGHAIEARLVAAIVFCRGVQDLCKWPMKNQPLPQAMDLVSEGAFRAVEDEKLERCEVPKRPENRDPKCGDEKCGCPVAGLTCERSRK